MESCCLCYPAPTGHVLPGSGLALWSCAEAWHKCQRYLRKPLSLLKVFATQKRNSSENSPATAPGSGEASASAWSSPAHCLHPTLFTLQPSFYILQPEICTLHLSPLSYILPPVACIPQPSFFFLHFATFILCPSCSLNLHPASQTLHPVTAACIPHLTDCFPCLFCGPRPRNS